VRCLVGQVCQCLCLTLMRFTPYLALQAVSAVCLPCSLSLHYISHCPRSQRSFLGLLLSGQDLTTGTQLTEEEVVAQVGGGDAIPHHLLNSHLG
jgi:hypothetical protein